MRKENQKSLAAFLRGSVALAMLFVLGLAPFTASAQCSMCTASIEAAKKERDDYDFSGLNKGILYMAIVPYLLMGAVGYTWYRRTHPKTAAKPVAKPVPSFQLSAQSLMTSH